MIDLLVVEQWHAGCLADCRSWCLDVTFVVDWVFRTNYLYRSWPGELITNVGGSGFNSHPGRWIFATNM